MRPEEMETYVKGAAAALGLDLSPDSRRGVIANLSILFERAAEFDIEPLDDALDPAGLLRL